MDLDQDIIRIMQAAQCDRLHAERLAEYRSRKEGISLTEVALCMALVVVIISVTALAGGIALDIVALWLFPALLTITWIVGRSAE